MAFAEEGMRLCGEANRRDANAADAFLAPRLQSVQSVRI